MVMDLMEKFASMKPSQQIGLMAEATEKLAAERDALHAENAQLRKKAELDDLYHRLESSGQNPHSTREDTMAWLDRLEKTGRLEALKFTMDELPGSIRKVASGVSSETDGEEKIAGKPDLKASRNRLFEAVMGGAGSDDL
jgi:hypothetical protein